MKKYITLAKISWTNGFAYRLNFAMWRVRQILSLLTAYFLWKAIFSISHKGIFGYSESMMMAYIFVSAFVQTVVLSVRSIDLAGVINSGELSNILVRPVSNFWYWISRDTADKILNSLFSFGELALLFFLLKPTFIFPPAQFVLLMIPALFLAAFLYYLISYFFSLLGFWTPDVWAPRFFLFILLQFTAGTLFPLDVLPQYIQRIISWTPFPSLVYIPSQIFLMRYSVAGITGNLAIGCLWVLIFLAIVRLTWIKGLRRYSSEGR